MGVPGTYVASVGETNVLYYARPGPGELISTGAFLSASPCRRVWDSLASPSQHRTTVPRKAHVWEDSERVWTIPAYCRKYWKTFRLFVFRQSSRRLW